MLTIYFIVSMEDLRNKFKTLKLKAKPLSKTKPQPPTPIETKQPQPETPKPSQKLSPPQKLRPPQKPSWLIPTDIGNLGKEGKLPHPIFHNETKRNWIIKDFETNELFKIIPAAIQIFIKKHFQTFSDPEVLIPIHDTFEIGNNEKIELLLHPNINYPCYIRLYGTRRSFNLYSRT